MIIIGAVDKYFGIGKDNKLLAHLPNDLEFFKENTVNKTIVLGSKTLASFKNGKPLPKREHIVLSRNKNYNHERIKVVRSVDELLSTIKDIPPEDVYVVGGGMVYKELLPYCDKAYITMIEGDLEADIFMPNIEELEDWECTYEGLLVEEKGIYYRHTIWERQEKK